MAQPAFSDLFGPGAAWDAANNKLDIPIAALQASGLTKANPTALEAYAALVKNAHTWLSANTDSSVLAASALTISAPVTWNGNPQTQFQFTERFYGSYQAPTFVPDQL